MALTIAGQRANALTFDWSGYSWQTDRADTGSEAVENGDFGRNDVLHLGILDNTTVPDGSAFRQTEGYLTSTGLGVGSAFISGDLYIPSGADVTTASLYEAMGIWGILGIASTDERQAYPILQFYDGANPPPADQSPNSPGSGTTDQYVGEIRGYDAGSIDPNGVWVVLTGPNADGSVATDPSAAINYGGWNTLRVSYIAGSTVGGGKFEYYLNGTLVATISGGDLSSVDPTTASLYGMILNSRTNGANGYDVYWSDVIASMAEEYYDVPAIAPLAIVGGEQSLGTYVDRRGLDWDSNKYAWGRVFGGDSNFDDTSTTVKASIAGAQLGADLFALGDPSTRAGFTFGYATQGANIALPAGGSAGTVNGTATSIGAYLTHADSAFYADLLGQYRFLSYDLTAPTASGTVTGGSIDTTAEAGVHWGPAQGLTITPFGQLVYEHVMLNSTSLGGMQASFGNSDALIARGRILAQAAAGNFTTFASAGASTDLLGAKKSSVDLASFQSTIGGPQAEFTAGLEGKLAPGFSLFGSGEYDVSFDGQSQSYTGRAGLRSQF